VGNAPHQPEVKTHPDHLLVGKKVKANPQTDMMQVLTAVLSVLHES
jgi:hypothetical protein